jgi:two-component system sensor histidine kinase DctS
MALGGDPLSSQHSIFSGPEAIVNQVIEITRSTALGEMASGIAHELNQPLGAIATFSQAGIRMLDRPEPMVARALDVFKQISQEALNAGEGIRRIRRLFDQEDLARAFYSMDDLIVEIRPVLDLLSRRYGGTLEFSPCSNSPAVSVDRVKIQHVVVSLVQNGFESAQNGSEPPRVAVTVSQDRYGSETSIIDSGPGIPEGTQNRLFKPFFTTKPQGTGLGLASCHSIIEAHEGQIGFENHDGQGCRFWFRLPLI